MPLLRFMKKQQERILVVEPNWLGDVIFTTPAFKAIKEHYPNSFLGVVVARRCAPILKNNPYIDKIYELDEKKEEKSIFAKIAFIRKIRSEQFNRSFFFHRSFTKTLLIFLAGVKKRTGYAYQKRRRLLNDRIITITKDSVHKQNYYLNILEKSGIKITDLNCKVYIQNKTISSKRKTSKCLIGINPFSNWPPKDWPLANYKKLLEILLNNNFDTLFLITSAKKSEKIKETFKKLKNNVVDLSGKTTLSQLASLYSRLDLVISGDSGPLHLAAAVNTSYIAIFGPTHPNCTKPITKTSGQILFKNYQCLAPCYEKTCPKNYQCINEITPQEVAKLVFNQFKNN